MTLSKRERESMFTIITDRQPNHVVLSPHQQPKHLRQPYVLGSKIKEIYATKIIQDGGVFVCPVCLFMFPSLPMFSFFSMLTLFTTSLLFFIRILVNVVFFCNFFLLYNGFVGDTTGRKKKKSKKVRR